MKPEVDLTYEELNGEIVVLDAGAQMVHRIIGETAEAVRGERNEVTRRRMVQAAVALGVAVGVSSIALPSAAAASSGGGIGSDPPIGSTYFGGAGDPFMTAPTGVSATAGDAEVTVSWNSVADATKYRVYVRTGDPLNPGQWTLAAVTTGTSAVVSTLTNGTTYDFSVVTVKGTQVSSQSAPKSATPQSAGMPAVPTYLSAVPFQEVDESWSVTLSWYKGSGGAEPDGYLVKVKLNPADSFSDPVDITAPDTFAKVGGFMGYVEFKVAAYTATDTSAYSAPFIVGD